MMNMQENEQIYQTPDLEDPKARSSSSGGSGSNPAKTKAKNGANTSAGQTFTSLEEGVDQGNLSLGKAAARFSVPRGQSLSGSTATKESASAQLRLRDIKQQMAELNRLVQILGQAMSLRPNAPGVQEKALSIEQGINTLKAEVLGQLQQSISRERENSRLRGSAALGAAEADTAAATAIYELYTPNVATLSSTSTTSSERQNSHDTRRSEVGELLSLERKVAQIEAHLGHPSFSPPSDLSSGQQTQSSQLSLSARLDLLESYVEARVAKDDMGMDELLSARMGAIFSSRGVAGMQRHVALLSERMRSLKEIHERCSTVPSRLNELESQVSRINSKLGQSKEDLATMRQAMVSNKEIAQNAFEYLKQHGINI